MKPEIKFEDLFQNTLADLYDAEKQIAEALPKMIAASSSEELSTALESHLEETKEQVSRLETIFERIAAQPEAAECHVMEALLSDGAKLIAEFGKSPVLDAALIAAAQKVEHYEIAGYTTASGLAEVLGQHDAFELLQETLEEETDADATLAEIADAILSGDAVAEEMEEDEEEEEEEEIAEEEVENES
jgi:ferritin-like metal-binding protein YciE